jgi:uncharacterized membrane protein YkvA (DUF1232 family)
MFYDSAIGYLVPFKTKRAAENTPSLPSTAPVDAEYVRRGARRITRDDIQKVVARADVIRKRFNPKGPLGRFIEDGRLLISVVKDYWKGNYRRIPFTAIAAITFSLLYVLNPWDIFPDFVPLLGQIDDASVLTICLLLIERDLQAYKAWLSLVTDNPPGSIST